VYALQVVVVQLRIVREQRRQHIFDGVGTLHRPTIIIGKGYVDFLSGGALGFDLMAAEMVLSLREKYPWIRLVMVLPFDGQADQWSQEQRKRWLDVIEASDKVIHVSHEYDKGVFFRRNHLLVENANLLLAAYDGQPGGTAGTVAYAKRHGVKVLRIAPVKGVICAAG